MRTFPALPARALRRAVLAASSLSLLGLTLSASPLSAQTLTIGTAEDAFPAGPFGQAEEASVAMGQTFMRPGSCAVTCYLQGFSFWLGNSQDLAINPEALQFRAYVAEWDDVVGGASTVRYTSDVFSGPMGPSQEYAFSAPNVEMLEGTRYVAFLSVVGLSATMPAIATADFDVVDGLMHPYSDGAWVFTNTGSTIDELTSSAWDFAGDPEFFQSRFSAQFSGSTAVPEPSSLALLALGGMALLFVARRRRA